MVKSELSIQQSDSNRSELWIQSDSNRRYQFWNWNRNHDRWLATGIGERISTARIKIKMKNVMIDIVLRIYK